MELGVMEEAEPDYPSINDLFDLGQGRIRRVEIQNYRSIKETSLDILPFTVLAGANGAGKSNIVDAFRFVSEALSLGLYAALERRGGIQAVRHRVPSSGGRQRTVGLRFLIDFQGGIQAEYRFRIISQARGAFRVGEEHIEMWSPGGFPFASASFKNGELIGSPMLTLQEGVAPREDYAELFFLPRVARIGNESLALALIGSAPGTEAVFRTMREMRVYAIVPDLLREPQDSDEGFILQADGRNAASVLRDLDPRLREELVTLLGHAVPGIVDVKTIRYGRKRGLEFLQAAGRKRLAFEGHQMSDGTLRLFGTLLALLQSRRSSIISIEEPETSLHIGALESLVAIMRDRVGHGEVIVTTHSPELIDFVSPAELRLVRREEGNTVVAEVSDHSKQMVREELFSLGELHRVGGLTAKDEPVSS